MRSTFVLVLLLGSHAYAATHVNISIAQHPADVKYVDGQAPAELRAGPSNHHSERFAQYRRSEGHSAQLKAADTNATANNMHMDNGFAYQQQHQQQFAQLRKQKQAKQNQEFERYIQSYHSGPTVETVFESASPASPQRYQVKGSSGSGADSHSKSQRLTAAAPLSRGSARVHTFERQVALPVAASGDGASQQQTRSQADASYTSAGAASVAAAPVSAASTDAGAEKPVYEQPGSTYSSSSSSSNGNNNYDQYNYNGNDDLHGHVPPSVNEPASPQDGYGGYASSDAVGDFYGPNVGQGYLPVAPSPQPSYPRQVVTKTIQIAQPALKAKKYEIRHPAIQKEFYDIEERVVIKPAGTIVVELERPVAKISKGETILPLGHPHPAVADAYTSNAQSVVQTQSVPFGVGSAGGSASSSASSVRKTQYANNQPAKATIGSTTIASTLTSSPSVDPSSMQDFVDSNLKRQYGSDKQFVAAPVVPDRSSFDEPKPSYNTNDDDLGAGDGERFYGGISGGYDAPARRDETDSLPRVQVSNNGAPTTYASSNSQEQHHTQYQPQPQPQPQPRPQRPHSYNTQVQYRGNQQSSYVPQQATSNFQTSSNNNNNNQNNNNEFVGEYLNRELYNNPNYQDFKPARLEEQPAEMPPRTQIIKHEHQIHLPPSQHNIYLSPGQRYATNEQRAEERARVQEIKPYRHSQRGSVLVYAAPAKQYADSQSPRYQQRPAGVYPQQQYRDDAAHRVQYSAPYSNMRYTPNEGGQDTFSLHYNHPVNAKGNLMSSSDDGGDQDDSDVVDAAPQELPTTTTKHHNGQAKAPQTHIQIQIPKRDEPDMPIVVSSTISPPQSGEGLSAYRQYHGQAAHGSHEKPSRYTDDPAESFGNVEPKPDCDQPQLQPNARYESGRLSQRQQQKFLRLVDTTKAANDESAAPAAPASPTLQADAVELNVKGTVGQVAPGGPVGSRVIAATPAPADHPGSESYHTRRIVVNHPFQTIREVVEHEPVTNYHQIQVHEPAMPALYQTPFSHGDLRDFPAAVSFYHNSAASTHGNLRQPLLYHHSQ